jgi:hypothetical protein
MFRILLGGGRVMKKLCLLVTANCMLAANAQAWTVTVNGTIYADQTYGVPDQLGLFGAPGTSLLGAAYSMTITTDPSLNTYQVISTSTLHSTDGGAGFAGPDGSAAAYAIAATVTNVPYQQADADPFLNYCKVLGQ